MGGWVDLGNCKGGIQMNRLTKSFQTRRSKYGAKRAEHNGQGFRSGLERDVYATLLLMERAGKIKNIRREQSIQLTPSIKHKADFVVTDAATGEDYAIEAKGATCPTWSLKRRLYIDFGPLKIEIWKKQSNRLGVDEVIAPGKFSWGRK
jgi:hypothetical protein